MHQDSVTAGDSYKVTYLHETNAKTLMEHATQMKEQLVTLLQTSLPKEAGSIDIKQTFQHTMFYAHLHELPAFRSDHSLPKMFCSSRCSSLYLATYRKTTL